MKLLPTAIMLVYKWGNRTSYLIKRGFVGVLYRQIKYKFQLVTGVGVAIPTRLKGVEHGLFYEKKNSLRINVRRKQRLDT